MFLKDEVTHLVFVEEGGDRVVEDRFINVSLDNDVVACFQPRVELSFEIF